MTVGGASAFQHELRLGAARAVRPVIERVSAQPLGMSIDTLLRATAERAIASEGARRRLAGYLFEHLDVQRYNLSRIAVGHRLVLRESPCALGYDATRFIGNDFAGAIQHKLDHNSLRNGVRLLEFVKPGSAKYATFRVPADVAEEAARLAGRSCRVQASDVTKAEVYEQLDNGLKQLAADGAEATSRLAQTARASGKGAAGAVVIGSALDLRPLLRKQMNGEHFAARRGVDAVEGAATAATASTLVAATTSAATALVTAGGTGAVTAAAVLTAPAWVVPVTAALVAGVGVRLVTGRLRRRVDARYAHKNEEGRLALVDDAAEGSDEQTFRLWVPAAAALLFVPTAVLWLPGRLNNLWVPPIR